MLTVTRKVYYCEHCKRHRLTKKSIEQHEPRCIYNPRRSVCGWHKDERPSAPTDFVPLLRQEMDLEWLRQEMDGCPACILAVVVQAGLTYHDREDLGFSYTDEVTLFRMNENETPW